MPRTNSSAAARRGPAGPALPDHPVQRTVPAATAGPVSSVFNMTSPTGKAKRSRPAPPDPDAVTIVNDKAVPPLLRGPGCVSPYQRLYEKLRKGQCAEGLTPSQARSFQAWAKKNRKAVTIRVYRDTDTADAWRMD